MMSWLLVMSIRAYLRWAPAKIKANCPGPSMGQETCGRYGLRMAQTKPWREALRLIYVRLKSHTDGPHNPGWYKWATGRARTMAVVGLIVLAAHGQSEGGNLGNPPDPGNIGHPGKIPGLHCPNGYHLNHRGTACKPDGHPQND